MFTIPILEWFGIGFLCFGMWFGFSEKEFSDIDFKMVMVGIVFIMMGPINIVFAIARLVGVIGREIFC